MSSQKPPPHAGGLGTTFLGPLALLFGMVGLLVTTVVLFMRSSLLYLVAAFAPIVATPGATFCSRSCHNLETLRASLGIYHAVFFGPVFDSISKRGYGPGSVAAGERSRNEVSAFLRDRTVAQRRTTIVALGGIDAMTAPQALALGFDGVAVLGAVWLADDPVKAWREIAASCGVSHLKTPLNPNSGVGEPDALQPLRKAV